MKWIHSFVIVLIFFAILIIPVSSQSDEDVLLNGVQNLSITPLPTGTAVLGSKEKMWEYQRWLTESALSITLYSNSILKVFGMPQMDWDESLPSSPSPSLPVSTVDRVAPMPIMVTEPVPIVTVTEVVPSVTIPYSSELITIGTITGGKGKKSARFKVPTAYWEIWYTVDPELMGGQDSGMTKGSDSSVFPSMSMVITDLSNPESVETIDPPGGLDKVLWQK
jgi:hypothetical protein